MSRTNRFRVLASRFIGLFSPRRGDGELDDEIRTHLELLAEEHVRGGMSLREARAAARREFGGVEQTKETYRDQRSLPWLDALAQDLRYASRTLRKSPGFTAAAILTLALGIGANTAIFSVVYGVLIRPLPYRDAERLVQFRTERNFSGRPRPVQTNFSLTDLDQWRQFSRSLESVALDSTWNGVLSDANGSEAVPVDIVSDAFFSTIGGRAVLGRPLGAADDASPVAVISHRLWLRRFSGSPSIIGSQLMLDSQPYTIVGVMDATFQWPSARIDVWRTAGFARTLNPAFARRGSGGFVPIGRLKPGATIEQARVDCTDVLRELTAIDPRYGGTRASAFGLREGLVADIKPALLVLVAAVGLVLFVTCANVTNLLLARNLSRARERAIRLALGASRGRLAAQSLVDSALIAMGGGAVGVAIAMGSVATLTKLNPAGIPRLDAVRVDLPVLFFALVLAAATTIVIGVLPAFHAIDVASALKLGGLGSTSGPGARRMRRLLVVAELAVSLVLLVGASLLGRSLFRLLNADLGASTAHVTAAQVEVAYGRVVPLSESRALVERIVDRVRHVPGVTSAGAGVAVPPNRAMLRITMNRVDEAVGQPTNYLVDAVSATPDFFTTLGLRLQRGRFFTETDDGGHQQVMIMSANTARQIFGDRDPIGRSVALPILTSNPNGRAANAPVTVVGIVDNVKYSGLDRPPDGVIYRPFAQQPWDPIFIVVRTARDIDGLEATLRREIATVDRSTVMYSVDTLDSLVSTAAAQPRFRTVVLMALAGLALALAAVGLYGVVAYAVLQRTAEIGVRMALGAAAGEVVRLVLREGLILASTGIALGLLVARVLTRVVANLLYGVPPTDLMSFVGAAAVLLLVTIVASYIPARRASRIDPIVALRQE